MGRLIIFVFFAVVLHVVFAQTIYDDFQIRSGELKQNETWNGKNILSSDVLIPESVTLTLEPNTWIIFNNTDTHNLGQFPDQVELITRGALIQSASEPALIFNISDPPVQELINQYGPDQHITIRPEPVDTEVIHQKVNRYKRHYVITWTVIYSILLVLF